MELKHIIIGLRLAVCLLKAITTVVLVVFLDGLKHRIEPTEALSGAGASPETSLMKCSLQSTPRLPAFSKDGDFVIGGVFSIHYKLHTATYNYLDKPEILRCTGRFVKSGRNECYMCMN